MEIRKSEKFFGREIRKANAQQDIGLINQYTLRELKPDEIFCFDVVLCDNEVDRHYKAFTVSTLNELAKLFVGKTGIMDHEWSAANQNSRIYACWVEKVDGQKTRLGETLHRLRATAYMLKNEATRPMIAAVEGGILKEVSVGVSVKECNCSICGKPLRSGECENGHTKGKVSAGGFLCVGLLEKPTDAFEFSFVAVPAQPGAGVTKAVKKPLKSVATPSECKFGITLPPAPSVPRSDNSRTCITRFAVIQEKHIWKKDLRAAWIAAGFARKELRLPPIRICWYVPEDEAKAKGWEIIGTFDHDARLSGLQDPRIEDTIFIRYDGSASGIQKAVLHELFHVRVKKNGRTGSEESEEIVTRQYEIDAARRLWNLSSKQADEFYFEECACTDWSKA